MTDLVGMTQARWNSMSAAERDVLRDNRGLTKHLIGLEGWRVEVVDGDGERRRFIVGKSNGWRPCHLEIKTTRSYGGYAAAASYASVRAVEKVR